LWISGNANWFPKICRQLAGRSRAERPFTVIWHEEPLPPPRASGLPWPRLYLREIAKIVLRDPRITDVYSNYWRLRSLARQGIPDLLAVTTRNRWEFLAERGIASHWVPMGYASHHGGDLNLQRDLDVIFLGTLTVPRRNRVIRRLRRRGVSLLTLGSWSDPRCWGESRNRLLNRTRIFLNIHRFPGELSGDRMILGMANKTLVISEPIYHPDQFIPGQHYVSATAEEMPETIEYYLAHDEERRQIAEEGHRLVTREVTMARSIARILELIKTHVG
jgi:hypothetical protein